MNIEDDDDHNLNCLLNNYYDDNDGEILWMLFKLTITTMKSNKSVQKY